MIRRALVAWLLLNVVAVVLPVVLGGGRPWANHNPYRRTGGFPGAR